MESFITCRHRLQRVMIVTASAGKIRLFFITSSAATGSDVLAKRAA